MQQNFNPPLGLAVGIEVKNFDVLSAVRWVVAAVWDNIYAPVPSSNIL